MRKPYSLDVAILLLLVATADPSLRPGAAPRDFGYVWSKPGAVSHAPQAARAGGTGVEHLGDSGK